MKTSTRIDDAQRVLVFRLDSEPSEEERLILGRDLDLLGYTLVFLGPEQTLAEDESLPKDHLDLLGSLLA